MRKLLLWTLVLTLFSGCSMMGVETDYTTEYWEALQGGMPEYTAEDKTIAPDAMPDDAKPLEPMAPLTLLRVVELAALGEQLDWADFAAYPADQEIVSGLHCLRYEVDENFDVLIGGAAGEYAAFVRLVCHAAGDVWCDLRADNVAAFLAAEAVWQYPPNLTVLHNDSIYPARSGTCSWKSANQGIARDGMDPIRVALGMKPLVLMPTVYSSIHPKQVFLSFPYEPSVVTVQVFRITDGEASYDEETVLEVQEHPQDAESGQPTVFSIIIPEGDYATAVYAKWEPDEADGRGAGSAQYTFRVKSWSMEMGDTVPVIEP